MGIALPTSETILSADWVNEEAYPSYYANRDVNRRMNKDHLKGSIVTAGQCVVSCAEFEGVRIKLDGHSRAEAWRRGQLEMPEELTLMVYKVESLSDMAHLYRSFNSASASETPIEYMYHLNKVAEFEPVSQFVKGSWKYAYNILGFNKREGEALTHYKEELLVIDSWGLTSKRGNTMLGAPTRAAMLKTLKIDRVMGEEFWMVFIDIDDNSCAEINRLRECIAENGVAGAVAIGMVYATALGAFQNFCDKRK
ncbi:MAG: hypothetical protein ACRCZ2_02835 [Fusobacteriaceae bacterium]